MLLKQKNEDMTKRANFLATLIELAIAYKHRRGFPTILPGRLPPVLEFRFQTYP